MKKKHWTQTPEGRKIMAQRKGRTYNKRQPEQTTNAEKIEASPIFAYALGYVESFLKHYTESADIPYQTLAAALGKAIQSKARR